MNVYDRQASLNLHTPPAVGIVGCGGVGTWAAIFCALSGIPKLVLFDSDKVEEVNLNRLPFPPNAVGRLKTQALADFIYSFRPECVILQSESLGPDSMFKLERISYLLDCTDDLKAQQYLSGYRFNGEVVYSYIRIGSDGTHITVADKVPAWAAEPERRGYRVTPSWGVPVAIASALGVAKMMKFYGFDLSTDIGELARRSK